jgi:hypothetical protein
MSSENSCPEVYHLSKSKKAWIFAWAAFGWSITFHRPRRRGRPSFSFCRPQVADQHHGNPHDKSFALKLKAGMAIRTCWLLLPVR